MNINDLVILIGNFQAAKSNPVIGSIYYCTGTIVRISDSYFPYEVLWKNKFTNLYKKSHLLIIMEY